VEDYKDWKDIQTPARAILAYQGYSHLEQYWAFGMGAGRFIHNPDTMEHFEQIVYLWGVAGSGKSTWIDMVSDFFMPHDVVAFGDTMEEKFGLSAIFKAKIALGSDIKEEFNLPAGQAQKMATYEMISVAIKNKTAISQKWTVPILFASNVFPRKWKNSQGSLSRRIFLMDFQVPVLRKDPLLRSDIRRTFGSLYRFANEAYLWLVREYGDKPLDDFLPKRFQDNRRHIKEMNNPLVQFLNDPTQVQSGAYILEKDFLARFTSYCKDRQYPRISAGRAEVDDALKQRGCKVNIEKRIWPLTGEHQKQVTGRFFVGIELVKIASEEES